MILVVTMFELLYDLNAIFNNHKVGTVYYGAIFFVCLMMLYNLSSLTFKLKNTNIHIIIRARCRLYYDDSIIMILL